MNWKPLIRRYVTTLKTLLIVFSGAFLANGHNPFPLYDVTITAILAGFLWAGLYTLNESTDQYLEDGAKIEPWIVTVSWLAILSSITVAMILSGLVIALIMSLMTVCQLLYSSHVTRLKRFVWAAPIFTGITNPTLRMLLGVIIVANQSTPWNIVYLGSTISLAIHLAFAIKTRAYRKERDKKLGYTYVSDYVANTFLSPLQIFTPIGLLYYLILIKFLIRGHYIVSYPALATIPIVLISILIVWRTNNLYDKARFRSEPLSIELYHGLCLAKIRQIVNLWEIIAIIPVYSLVAFSLTPLSHFVVAFGLIAYRQLSLPTSNSDR